jgi:hypothetical protein
MKLQVVFTRDELLSFASQWLPLKVLLGDAANEDRYLSLSDPQTIELVAGLGLRIACRAQIRWPVLGMSVPITARQLTVLMKPRIEQRDGQPALVFRLTIEQADLSGVPARLDATITEAVNRALAERVKPGWNFGTMLTRSIIMPVLIATTESIDLAVTHGEVAVTDEAFTFELGVRADATRRTLVMNSAK